MATQEVFRTKKITMSAIGVDPSACKKLPAGEHSRLAIIGGIATGIRIFQDVNKTETFEALSGEFEAVNLQTGEIYSSGSAFLPPGLHEPLVDRVKGLKNEGDAIQFAFEVHSIAAKNPIGYSYLSKDLLSATEIAPPDPLAGIRKFLLPPQNLALGDGKTVEATTQPSSQKQTVKK